jgi:uncharacterized membrane protein (DUF106 family)
MGINDFLDPIFSPLLNFSTLWAVVILSFIISLVITLVYKYTTNQSLMKQLKEEMKEFQKDIKDLRKEPAKAMQVQKRAMQTNMKYMMHSMRSTLFSFIPIIIIFGWMTANFAYSPIMPGQEFTTTVFFEENVDGQIELNVPEGISIKSEKKKEVEDGEVKWILSGEQGEYLLEYVLNDKSYNKGLLIDEKKYEYPIENIDDGFVKRIEIEHKSKKLLNLFGWKLGWLGTYIIFSIVFSILIRKIIKVY